MRWRGAGLLAAGLWVGVAVQAAPRPEMTAHERDLLGDVYKALQARDCKRAVERLNAGLARQFPDIYIMAGSMYEQGLCLSTNWERAERMYQLARSAGHGAGVLRLIAGYAHQRRDPASALWWAHQPGSAIAPAFCSAGEAAAKDPDAFVAALRAWPAGRLAQCTYVVGVLAAISGEVEYPSVAQDYAMSAELTMDFQPAAGKVDWATVDVTLEETAGVVDGDAMRDRNARSVQNSFRTYLSGVSDGVLARFARPDGIDPAWRVQQSYAFTFRLR